jgi:hypothetical protein
VRYGIHAHSVLGKRAAAFYTFLQDDDSKGQQWKLQRRNRDDRGGSNFCAPQALMFEYFPHHYGWNFATLLALNLGGNLSEVDDACRGLIEVSVGNGSIAGEEFFYGWKTVGDRLFTLAARDSAAQHHVSASNKYRRAAICYLIAERTQSPLFAPRRDLYLQMQQAFRCFVQSGAENCEFADIPYRSGSLPALIVRAAAGDTPAPWVLHFVGFDAMKELVYLSGLPQELARRGISTVIVDLPGAGEALRLRGMHTTPDAGVVAAACADFLQSRATSRTQRIGVTALGLAGYSALRAMTCEPRLACCAVLGATYDWDELFQHCLAGADAQQPLPSFFEHVKWAFGLDTIDDCMQVASQMHLRDVLHRIERPLLMVHGENERPMRLTLARHTLDGCTNSQLPELRILRAAEGGAEYCSVDNFPLAFDAIADWLALALDIPREQT